MSIDIFLAYAKFGHEQRISLHDRKSAEGFTAHVNGTLEQALTRRTLLHGQRTQNLFEALIVSLGNYKLLKTEDAGRVHAEEKYKIPDFRAVLNDGSNLLIEVKNRFCKTPFRQRFTMAVTYLGSELNLTKH